MGERSEKIKQVSTLAQQGLEKVIAERILSDHVLHWEEIRRSGRSVCQIRVLLLRVILRSKAK